MGSEPVSLTATKAPKRASCPGIRQLTRELDDEALLRKMADALGRLVDLEEARKARGMSRAALCLAAGVDERTFRRGLSGQVLPEPLTLRALERALMGVRRVAVADGNLAGVLHGLMAAVATECGRDPREVIAADPHANGRDGRSDWLAVMRIRAAAVYLLVTEYDVPISKAAALIGVSKQAVSKSLREVEERREIREFDAMLDQVASYMVVRR